jgi:hypothetical protein
MCLETERLLALHVALDYSIVCRCFDSDWTVQIVVVLLVDTALTREPAVLRDFLMAGIFDRLVQVGESAAFELKRLVIDVVCSAFCVANAECLRFMIDRRFYFVVADALVLDDDMVLQTAIQAFIPIARIAPEDLCESGVLDGIQESYGEMSEELGALLHELFTILRCKFP